MPVLQPGDNASQNRQGSPGPPSPRKPDDLNPFHHTNNDNNSPDSNPKDDGMFDADFNDLFADPAQSATSPNVFKTKTGYAQTMDLLQDPRFLPTSALDSFWAAALSGTFEQQRQEQLKKERLAKRNLAQQEENKRAQEKQTQQELKQQETQNDLYTQKQTDNVQLQTHQEQQEQRAKQTRELHEKQQLQILQLQQQQKLETLQLEEQQKQQQQQQQKQHHHQQQQHHQQQPQLPQIPQQPQQQSFNGQMPAFYFAPQSGMQLQQLYQVITPDGSQRFVVGPMSTMMPPSLLAPIAGKTAESLPRHESHPRQPQAPLTDADGKNELKKSFFPRVKQRRGRKRKYVQTSPNPPSYEDEVVLGIYTRRERWLKIQRYRSKRATRCFDKKILYACRKNFADKRPRIGGRFVKLETLPQPETPPQPEETIPQEPTPQQQQQQQPSQQQQLEQTHQKQL